MTVCPTPDKRCYPSMGAAQAARKHSRNQKRPLIAYRCACGLYHLGTVRKRIRRAA